ncbi:MAG: helix-turn-helix domain-containing protein [Patescibacteria group bacterium]|nr:helix-turn-helix domain-containing protein [Patescibacteria group bacterium]
MSATLGGLIKDFRIKKGIQQIDIAFSLGWKETSRLSRIEQGKSAQPSRDLLENIIKAMRLQTIEKNQLLLAGNYLPNKHEIEHTKERVRKFIDNWPYPAHLFDFSWRTFIQNEAMSEAYNLPSNIIKLIKEGCPYIFEILFHPDLLHYKKMKKENQTLWRDFLRNLILQFRNDQIKRSQQKWYIEHIKNMMKNELFKTLWIESQNITLQDALIGKFAMTAIPHPKDQNKLLKFYLFASPVIEDPRFEILMMVPSDMETYKFYNRNKKSNC